MSTLAAPLTVAGTRFSGAPVRSQNVMAATAIANIVKSSLGPVGLDKMLVDDIGDVTVTNDGATILKMLDVEHPAAKVLVELAQLQDEEVGDGTTSVVIIAAELLKFCDPVTDWPECSIYDTALTVETTYESMNPDQLEEMHHKGIQLTPPNITLSCRCRYPNYWKLVNATEDGSVHTYKCASLPPCKSGDFCGNVNYELNSLYQSCLCPRNHICVHNGGITHLQISELLYRGKGWRAYCQPINDEYSYEDY